MSDIKFIYISLKLLQIFSMFALSFWVAKSKNDKVYWKRAIGLILIWSLIDGLRFARDQDYNSYYPRFVLMANGNNPDEYEYLFYLICRLFGLLSLPYWTFIFAGSAILIISCLWLFKDYRKYLPFIIILIFWDLGKFDIYDMNKPEDERRPHPQRNISLKQLYDETYGYYISKQLFDPANIPPIEDEIRYNGKTLRELLVV